VPEYSEFIVEMALRMKQMLHAPDELIPNKQELCVILQGLCLHGGCLRSRGQVFGEDMLLNNEALRKPYATLAMTFLHLLVLNRPLLNWLLQRYPEAVTPIRRSYVKFAVIRGMLYKAELYKRRKHADDKRQRAKKTEITAVDRVLHFKPMGDAEDVTGDHSFARPAYAIDTMHMGSTKSISDPSNFAAVYTSTGSGKARSTSKEHATASRLAVAGRAIQASSGRLSSPSMGATFVCSPEGTAAMHDAMDLLVGGSERDGDGADDKSGAGVSASDLTALTRSARGLTVQLRTRTAGLEAAASRLLEQARLLEDL